MLFLTFHILTLITVTEIMANQVRVIIYIECHTRRQSYSMGHQTFTELNLPVSTLPGA